LSQNKSKKQKSASKNPVQHAQHELHSHQHQLTNADANANAGAAKPSILERFPYETLLHVTSYLEPPALAHLAAVSSYFKGCIADDVVWKLALYSNILEIQPEREKDSPRAFLLRRIESTWRAEYIERFRALT